MEKLSRAQTELEFIGAKIVARREHVIFVLYREVLFSIDAAGGRAFSHITAQLPQGLATIIDLPADAHYAADVTSCFQGFPTLTEKILALYKMVETDSYKGVLLIDIYKALYKSSEVGSSTH